MKTRFIFALLLCLSVSSFAQKSTIDFEIRNLGVNVDGYFDTFYIEIQMSSDSEPLSISGKIIASSIKTGIDSRDEHLLKEDYFDVEKHKYIILKSTSISKISELKYTVKADLSIKGKTKKITIPVTIQKVNDKHKISSYFEINRKDFGIGGSSFVMSKTVRINVRYYQDI